MVINKFAYAPISRVTIDGKRHYATPDGNKLPSVTSVLSATKPQESLDALNNWRKRVGVARAQEITTESANVGTTMHKMLEDHCNGRLKPPGSNLVQQIASGMAQTVINNGLVNLTEIWGVEVPLYFPGLYAGTTDLAGVWKNMPAICDFKQTNKPKKKEWIEDYFLQLTAYMLAHDELFNTSMKCGVILMCSRNNEYQEFVLEGNELEEYKSKWLNRLEMFYNLQ